jgi:general secretion pathway protein F
MIALGAFLSRWGAAGAAVVAGAAIGFRRHIRTDGAARIRWDRFLFRLPLWGNGYALLVNLRFARTLAILLRGGVPLLDGFVLAGRAGGSPWVESLVKFEAESVRHGGTLAAALRRIPPLARSLPGWVQTGEAGGEMDRLLDAAARRFQGQWDRFVARCLSLLEPSLILLIGGFVLLVTLSVLLPIISMTQSVAR